MAKKSKNNFSEEELRQKIREELEREHQSRVSTSRSETDRVLAELEQKNEINQSELIENYLQQQVEDEVYSSYPEFIRCENHLNEIRWFTAHELSDEYEFYPVVETWWDRLKSRLSRAEKIFVPDTPEIRSLMAEYREEIRLDAENRAAESRRMGRDTKSAPTDAQEKKIYEEELDRFYQGKKGYKKYRNHLGEIRWLTAAEVEKEEESLEEVITTRQIIARYALWLGAALLLLLAGWFTASRFEVIAPKGFVVISLNEPRAQLYIDHNLAAGFQPGQTYQLTSGEHLISLLLPGYKSVPAEQKISLAENDTVRLSFRLEAETLSNAGLVLIESDLPEARVFTDGNFRGYVKDNHKLILAEGGYTITLEEPGYDISPASRFVEIHAGDTLQISFGSAARQKRTGIRTSQTVINTGLIEVHSSVPGAEIYLDGKLTGLKSDYVMQRIPFGQHVIRLEKEGYKVYPLERVIRLSEDQKQVRLDFTLTSTLRRIELSTQPVAGKIFINNKELGQGRVIASLPLGEHTVRFGMVEYYEAPEEQKIVITDHSAENLQFTYRSSFSTRFKPAGVAPNPTLGSINTGYILEGLNFKNSVEYGPEIQQNKILNEAVWLLGFAFQYRNPPGKDALTLSFQVPDNLNLQGDIHLKLWIYSTAQNYPLAIKGKSYYQVYINGVKFREEVLPGHDQSQAGENVFDSFIINNVLRRGSNRILISTTDQTTAHLILWKAVVE